MNQFPKFKKRCLNKGRFNECDGYFIPENHVSQMYCKSCIKKKRFFGVLSLKKLTEKKEEEGD